MQPTNSEKSLSVPRATTPQPERTDSEALPQPTHPSSTTDTLERTPAPAARLRRAFTMPAFPAPQPVVPRGSVILKQVEWSAVAVPSRPDFEIELLQPTDENDPQVILLAGLVETPKTSFKLAFRLHDIDAFFANGGGNPELIGVKEVFAAPYQDVLKDTIAEAELGREAGCEVAIDEVWVAQDKFPFGTMRLGGEIDMRKALDIVPSVWPAGRPVVVCQIAMQIAKQLVRSHQKQVAHRDLKMSNIFLQLDGTARIGDFGEGEKFGGTSRKTGTYGCMPLEQYEGAIDSKSDMWSFGALLLTALTGSNPFADEYRNPCLRKLELLRECEDLGFHEMPPPERLLQKDDKKLLLEVVGGLTTLYNEFRPFAALVMGLLKTNPEERLSAPEAFTQLACIYDALIGGRDVDWKTLWQGVAAHYSAHDPSAKVRQEAISKLNESLDGLREVYFSEVDSER